MNETLVAPPGYGGLERDVDWDPGRHLDLRPPERVTLLEEWGPDAAGANALSPLAITAPFQLLSDEGVAALQEICGELEQFSVGDERIAKKVRGSIYRSRFLHGMYHDESVLAFLRELAQAPLEPHPVSHHAIHINYAPDDLSRNVDQWHRDVISFDYVLMVTDPRPMRGGRFEYFLGSVEEGRALLESGAGLPPERVASPEFPGPGWAVLQQGHRVLHRAARLEERYQRITIVGSYWTPLADREDPTDLPTILSVDGAEIALVEWSRYQARVAAHRLEHFARTKTDFAHPPDELQRELREIAARLEEAAAAFDVRREGDLISFGPGT
jgi:hypothetical protein